MTGKNEPTFLAKLADLFRAEGDMETADALVARCESMTARSISDTDRDRVLSLQRKGIRLDNRGAHDEAEGCFSVALRLMEDALGPEHVDIIDHLNDLARCRFNGGDYEAALKHYSRLARATERAHGPDDMLVKIARHYVERCRKGLRDAMGARRLQAHMDSMLQHARGIRLVDASNDQDRLRDVARRLMTRGRHAWAVRLYERWIETRLRDAPPDDDLALLDIRDYATALRRAGMLGRAALVLQQVVAMRNRRSARDGDNTELLRAMADWQSCLEELGELRSATETARLADSIASARANAGMPGRE
jgi:hypothetical protein